MKLAEHSGASALRELFRALSRRRKKQLAALFVMMLIGAVGELMTIGAVLPFLQLIVAPEAVTSLPLVQRVLDVFGWDRSQSLIVPAAFLLIFTAIVSAAARLLLTWASQKFVYGVGYDLDVQIFSRTIRQPYGFYIRRNSSEVLSGLEKVNLVLNGVLVGLMQGVTSAVIATFIMALLFAIDPFTAMVAAASMGLLYVAISLSTGRALRWIAQRSALFITARVKTVQESLGGIRDIILDQSHHVFERKFQQVDREFRGLSSQFNFISTAPRFLVEGAGIVLIALLSLYYSRQPGGMVAAIPVLGALAVGAQRLLPLIQNMYVGWTYYSGNRHAMGDVIRLMKGPVLTSVPRRKDIPPDPFGDRIELRTLSFRYGPDAPALDNINLTIRKGERVGFIGTTGSGKSTLVDVMMGLLQPSSGEILVGSEPLSDRNLENWQAQIAHVPQAIFLLDDTIASNIAFGTPEADIDMDRVHDAARRAGIHAFVEGLPDGYGTTIGERGIRLSGGQRQRIGIARALYKEATVLILDEATSALDSATEKAVMGSINSLDRDLTVLLIAHRLSTLAICDTIYRLEGGRVVEQGSYEEMVRQTGVPPPLSAFTGNKPI
ncbi:MAG: ABC transporter ATP-binding protein/permease [Pseudomonadota bacterium]|nr:ABC transporter ATP-binding protein/permease [Pseudomonadota bacterium]